MTPLVALVSALVATAPLPADTVVAMRRGERVVVPNLAGELVIEAWDRDELSIDEHDDAELRVERDGRDVIVRRARRRGRSVDATLRVPRWADVEVGGPSLEVRAVGIGGALMIRNVSGEIRVRDARGSVEARSIDGDIEIDGALGGVSASSQSDDVTVSRARGPIEVHSGSGDLWLFEIESASVRAETQDGDVTYSGTIEDGGSYGFFVHDGDAVIEVADGVNATFGVSTYDGEFDSDFPVRVQRFTGGREFDFVLGDGSARVEIEVFDGEIHLRRR